MSTTSEWDVNISLRVFDPRQLLAAAIERARQDDSDNGFYPANPAEHYREGLTTADGEPDIGACLQMLLDPGSLPGVSIHESNARVIGGSEENDDG